MSKDTKNLSVKNTRHIHKAEEPILREMVADLEEQKRILEQEKRDLLSRIGDLEKKEQERKPIKRVVFSLSIREDILSYLKIVAERKRWSIAAIVEEACYEWIQKYASEKIVGDALINIDSSKSQ